MSPQETERLTHAALESTGGKFVEAANLLGIDYKAFYKRVQSNPTLCARWGRGEGENVPTDAVTVHRPAALEETDEPDPLKSEVELAESIAKEDALVQRGLDRMGLNRDARASAMACAAFMNKHYIKAIEMLGGGIVHSFFNVKAEIEKIDARLNELNGNEEDRAEQFMLREDRRGLLQVLIDMKKNLDAGHLIAAKVHMMAKSGNKPKEKRKNYLQL